MKLSQIKQLMRLLKIRGYRRTRPMQFWYKQWDCPNDYHHYRAAVSIWDLERYKGNITGMIDHQEEYAQYRIREMMRAGS